MRCSICRATGHNKRRCPNINDQNDQHYQNDLDIAEPVIPSLPASESQDEPETVTEPVLQKYFAASATFQEDFPLFHTLIQHTSVSIDGLLHHMLPGHSHTSLQYPALEDQLDSHPSEETEYSEEPSK